MKKKFSTWLSELFSSSTSVSSKRVFGAIGFMAMIVKVCTMHDSELVTWTLAFCVSMLGLETVANIFQKPKPNP